MAHYKLILAYDGTDFAGSQRQTRRRTVQGELEKALSVLGWQESSTILAGRTDTGVHASSQVVAFNLDWRHSLMALRDALNAKLPRDMAALSVDVVESSFHPRFDASARKYCYHLFGGQVRDPLRERYAWRVWPVVQLKTLVEAARIFVGRHDFSAFGSPLRSEGSTSRNVTHSRWRKINKEMQYEIEADAFLYRMVRRLVYVQVAVAQGRCLMEDLEAALKDPRRANKTPAGLAPAHGLSLVAVDYLT